MLVAQKRPVARSRLLTSDSGHWLRQEGPARLVRREPVRPPCAIMQLQIEVRSRQAEQARRDVLGEAWSPPRARQSQRSQKQRRPQDQSSLRSTLGRQFVPSSPKVSFLSCSPPPQVTPATQPTRPSPTSPRPPPHPTAPSLSPRPSHCLPRIHPLPLPPWTPRRLISRPPSPPTMPSKPETPYQQTVPAHRPVPQPVPLSNSLHQPSTSKLSPPPRARPRRAPLHHRRPVGARQAATAGIRRLARTRKRATGRRARVREKATERATARVAAPRSQRAPRAAVGYEQLPPSYRPGVRRHRHRGCVCRRVWRPTPVLSGRRRSLW